MLLQGITRDVSFCITSDHPNSKIIIFILDTVADLYVNQRVREQHGHSGHGVGLRVRQTRHGHGS